MTELAVRRYVWDRGVVGDGSGYSSKLSLKLLWEPRDLWVGAYWERHDCALKVYVCLVPCLPIRVHLRRSYGGRFPSRAGARP